MVLATAKLLLVIYFVDIWREAERLPIPISISSSSIVAIISMGRLIREMNCGGITSVTTLILGTLVIADLCEVNAGS